MLQLVQEVLLGCLTALSGGGAPLLGALLLCSHLGFELAQSGVMGWFSFRIPGVTQLCVSFLLGSE